MVRPSFSLSFWTLVLAGGLVAPAARAHFDMEGALKSRGGDQKIAPCEGKDWGSGPVYTFEPGATITLQVYEGIPHDGYFRVSFDDAGDDDFVDPMSIAPINPNRYGTNKKCQGTAQDHCGESDFCSVVSTSGGPSVLWDNLDPHIPSSFLDSRSWTWTVTLPEVECEQCTIQVMQVMEDPAGGAHGPFDGEDDLYYRCIDIVIEAGAGETTGTTSAPADNNGIDCSQAVMTDAGVTLPDDEVVVTLPDGGTTPAPGGNTGYADGGVAAGPGTPGAPAAPGSPTGMTPAAAESGCSVAHAGGRSAGPAALAFALGLFAFGWRRRRPAARNARVN